MESPQTAARSSSIELDGTDDLPALNVDGVLVNKRSVRCARLEHGDVITLGEAQFRYTVAPVPMGAISPGQALSRRRANQ